MKRVKLIIVLLMSACVGGIDAATDAEASAIVGDYDRLHQLWLSEMRLAPNAQSLNQITQKRPDTAEFAAKLKTLLSKDLAHEWTLRYGAWLLRNDSKLKAESQRALLNAVEKHHQLSPLVGDFCVAMVHLNQAGEPPRPDKEPLRSRGMNMLEKIKTKNPEPKVQGQAALALSIMLGSLGDDRLIMERRIKNLREAIIKSADVKIGNVTVADIARDELYKINHLSIGRVAPPIEGIDSAKRPLKLADFRGKVVMLVFWSSWDQEAARFLEILRKSVTRKVEKPFIILGVNRDSLINLRTLEADRIVTWRNFSDPEQKIVKSYRVASWPYCMVLDKDGVIRYRGVVGSFADAVANDLLLPQNEESQKQ